MNIICIVATTLAAVSYAQAEDFAQIVHQADEYGRSDAILKYLDKTGARGVQEAAELVEQRLEVGEGRFTTFLRGIVLTFGRAKQPEASRQLIRFLSAKNDGLRKAAADALFREGSEEESIALLEAFRRESVSKNKEALARAMGQNGHANPVPVLTVAIKEEKNEQVRAVVAETLGRLGGEGVVEDLMKLLEDPSVRAQQGAIEGLGATRSARVLPTLKEIATKDAHPGRKNSALEALGNFHSEEVIQILEEAYKSTDGPIYLRTTAMKALIQAKPEREDSLTLEALRDADTSIRLYALHRVSFGNRFPAELVSAIEKMAKDDADALVRAAAKQTLELIQQRQEETREKTAQEKR